MLIRSLAVAVMCILARIWARQLRCVNVMYLIGYSAQAPEERVVVQSVGGMIEQSFS